MYTKANLPYPRSFLVAITGSIGSGKSSVLDLFSHYQPTISCDVINRNLILFDKQCQNQIIDCFGQQIISNGVINSSKLKTVIFSNADDKKKLESIMHPLIFKKIVQWIEVNKNALYLVVEVPLLIESGWGEIFDKILLVKSDLEHQKKRVMKRDKMDKQNVEKIISKQLDTKVQEKYVHFTISNTQNFKFLQSQVSAINIELIKQIQDTKS